MPSKIADTGTATAIAGTVWTHLAHLNDVLQLLALVVTIVSGLAAGMYHIQGFLARRRERTK